MTSRQRNSYSYFLAFEKDINNFQHPRDACNAGGGTTQVSHPGARKNTLGWDPTWRYSSESSHVFLNFQVQEDPNPRRPGGRFCRKTLFGVHGLRGAFNCPVAEDCDRELGDCMLDIPVGRLCACYFVLVLHTKSWAHRLIWAPALLCMPIAASARSRFAFARRYFREEVFWGVERASLSLIDGEATGCQHISCAKLGRYREIYYAGTMPPFWATNSSRLFSFRETCSAQRALRAREKS